MRKIMRLLVKTRSSVCGEIDKLRRLDEKKTAKYCSFKMIREILFSRDSARLERVLGLARWISSIFVEKQQIVSNTTIGPRETHWGAIEWLYTTSFCIWELLTDWEALGQWRSFCKRHVRVAAIIQKVLRGGRLRAIAFNPGVNFCLSLKIAGIAW